MLPKSKWLVSLIGMFLVAAALAATVRGTTLSQKQRIPATITQLR